VIRSLRLGHLSSHIPWEKPKKCHLKCLATSSQALIFKWNMALYKQAPQLRKRGESKSDRISLRWKEHVWHFHSEHWGTLKQCWFDVMVGSYCCVEKVSVFTPAFLDKLLQLSMDWTDEMRVEWRWVCMVTSHKNKSKPPRGIPFLLSHWTVCFAFNVLVSVEGPLAIVSVKESKQRRTWKRVRIAIPWDLNSSRSFYQNSWIIRYDSRSMVV